jgi:alpha-beta hydrolase superfamily lysophospholipase
VVSAEVPMKRAGWRRRLVRALLLVLVLVLAYAAVLAGLWLGQEKLLFRPRTLPAEHRFNFGADVHEVFIEVPDARLNALHLRLPAPDGVVFYLHGNAGHLQSWFVNTDLYRRANLDLFMLDYRGFGKSTGRIESQAQLQADVRAAWDHIAAQYEGRRRVFVGRSLGTGLVAGLAAEVQPELTVLISPYESIQALAADIYPWVPGAVLRYPLRTDQALPQIQGPVLLLHGDRDATIPLEHSRRLTAWAPTARLVVVEGAGHNDLQSFESYRQALAEALALR